MHLEHVGIAVSPDHFQATVAFYEQVLGWNPIRTNPGGEIFLSDGDGGRVELFSRDVEPLSAPHHVAFVVAKEEMESVVARLDESGVPHEPSRRTPAEDTVLYFHDPAGNYCQVIVRAEPLAA